VTAPKPPANLASRTPLIIEVPAGALLHRFHNGAFGPVYFDTSDLGRLNAPDGSYGTTYVAAAVEGAFAESFERNPGLQLLARDFIASKAYATLSWPRPLKLAMLHGRGLSPLGATAAVTHGAPPYAIAQQWSAALFHHPANLDGIAYRASHDDDELCYAIFERAGPPDIVETRKDLHQNWFYQLMLDRSLDLTD